MRYYVKVSNLDGTHERYTDGSFGSEADARKVVWQWREAGYRAGLEAEMDQS
jgi:hypothetical protein